MKEKIHRQKEAFTAAYSRIPESFIQELKIRNPLEQTAGAYVSFKRAGANLVACCPFHSERTPSFTLFSPGDHFYCFGCGAGGDVISFVMKMENLDYMGALEYLANRSGMTLPEEAENGQKIDKKRFFEMNRAAARFFHDKLLSPAGVPALEYLTKRGLSREVIRHFGLGFAGESFDELTGFLAREGYTPEEMRLNFLCGVSERTKRPFDYFRGRVMFPIIDISNRVCAFGGRVMGDALPKYLNSSDTPVFKKSRTLFAMNFARSVCADGLILCEGYMDVIALHAAGFTNAVATLGTAITGEQARIMRRYTQNVYICYDSDEAGRRAAKRAIEILGEADMKVKVITLKGAKDPDEYIKSFGKEAFKRVLEGADGHIEYTFNSIKDKYNLDAPEDKLSFAKEVCAALTGVSSALEREVYLGKLAALTGIDINVLRRELERTAKRRVYEKERSRVDTDLKRSLGYGDRVNPDKVKFPQASAKEEGIIGILLIHPEFVSDASLRQLICPDDFFCEFNRRALNSILALAEGGAFDFALLQAEYSPEESGALMRMRIEREQLRDNGPEVLKELAAALHAEKQKASVGKIDSAETLEEGLKRLKKAKS